MILISTGPVGTPGRHGSRRDDVILPVSFAGGHCRQLQHLMFVMQSASIDSQLVYCRHTCRKYLVRW